MTLDGPQGFLPSSEDALPPARYWTARYWKPMLSLPIARITRPVVTCAPGTEPATLVTQMLEADTNLGVVLDDHHCPLGVVRLHRLLLPPLRSAWPTAGIDSPQLCPVGLAIATVLEPIGRLPVSLSTAELCAHLARREAGHWAIVDGQGQFLGLLNSELALSWLASQWVASSPTVLAQGLPALESRSNAYSGVFQPLPQPQNAVTATPELPDRSWPQPGGTSLPGAPTLPLPMGMPSTLPLGWQWLEALPIPLQLQTDTGIIWGQNRAWTQSFGDRSDRVPETPTAPLTGIGGSSSSHAPPTSRRTCGLAPPATGPDGDAPLPTLPRTTPTGIAEGEPAEVPLGIATPTRHAYAYVCTLDTGEEKVWQFLSLPLPPRTAIDPVLVKEEWLGADRTENPDTPLRLLLAIEVTPIYTQNQLLIAENRDLWQRNQAKDDFLMSLSHDIKNPLTAILGLASLIQTTTVGKLNPRQQQYMQLIHHNARLLTTLANQSFELACLDAGQLKLNYKPVDLVAVCERAIVQAQALLSDSLATAAPSRSLPVSPPPSEQRVIQQEWTIDRQTERLLADELRLCQMLTHLLSNALKFSNATDQVGLRVSRWHPDWLALTVWDTGMGIPAADQSRLFQKSQRLQFAPNAYPGGVGLGLALTYRLVRLHGGVISFHSEEGMGSEFTLLLPSSNPNGRVVTTGQGGSEEGEGLPPASAPPPAIVVVTEPPSQQQTLIAPLQALGCRVVIARFPRDLLEKAQCLQPTVIFLDESWLADTDTAILTVLKADPATAHIPVLATVPHSASASLLRASVDGILSLPTQMSLLQSWLERLAVKPGNTAVDAPPAKSLTLLSLSQLLPDSLSVERSECPLLGAGSIDLPGALYQGHHRLLEADDLEQAALLATVWYPDLLLLRGDTLTEPEPYLTQIQMYPELASRAIVVLNGRDMTVLGAKLGLRLYAYSLRQPADVPHFLAYLQQLVVS